MGNCRCLEQKEDEKKEILKEETPETLPGKETQNDMAILETFIKENPKFYNSIIKLQSHYRGIKTREDVRLRCSNRPKKKDEKISDYVSEVKTLPAAEPEKPNPQSKKVQIDTPNDRIVIINFSLLLFFSFFFRKKKNWKWSLSYIHL